MDLSDLCARTVEVSQPHAELGALDRKLELVVGLARRPGRPQEAETRRRRHAVLEGELNQRQAEHVLQAVARSPERGGRGLGDDGGREDDDLVSATSACGDRVDTARNDLVVQLGEAGNESERGESSGHRTL